MCGAWSRGSLIWGSRGRHVLRESGADAPSRWSHSLVCRLAMVRRRPGVAQAASLAPRGDAAVAQVLSRGWLGPVDIIQVGGWVEVAPLLNLSHWIVDSVDTEQTGQRLGGAGDDGARSGAGGEFGELEAESGRVLGFDGTIGKGAAPCLCGLPTDGCSRQATSRLLLQQAELRCRIGDSQARQ